MSTALFKNNATATLAVGISSSATTIVLSSGLGALFPLPTASSYFYGTLYDSLGNYEIVKCTARTTDSLTVVRGQEGTTPLAFATGDGFAQRLTAGGLNNFAQLEGNNTFSGTNTFSGSNTFSGAVDLGALAAAVTPTVGDSSTKVATTAWTAAAISAAVGTAGGKIVQIVKATTTASSVSTSFPTLQATSHSASITPTSASSKILVIVSSSAYTFGTGAIGVYSVYRGSTNLCGNGTNKFTIESGIGGGTNQFQGSVHMTFLDEPSATSSLTYTVYQGCANGGSSEYNISLFATMLLVEIL